MTNKESPISDHGIRIIRGLVCIHAWPPGLVIVKAPTPGYLAHRWPLHSFPGGQAWDTGRAGMGYGHGLRLSGLDGEPKKSPFVTGEWVTYTTHTGRRVRGQVVGPDQEYFPSPDSVFVSFPASGFTHLLPVADLELVGDASRDG